jgi:lipoate-protein ligase A
MKCLDLTLPTPAENLACDEALLDVCEEGCGHQLLRFWEPQTHFVVLGYANRVATEVDREACDARNIPILRRCSGGGTVVQGPGCLNYSLLLKSDGDGPLRGIASANRFVMERNRAALEMLLSCSNRRQEAPPFKSEKKHRLLTTPDATMPEGASSVSIQGYTDLATGGLKFSGNAQRRKKRFLLFHGTFLLQFDLALIGTILPMPSKQPAYRHHRAHQDFLTNLAVPADSVKRVLQRAWRASECVETFPHEQIALLTRDKYSTAAWNLRF